MNYKKLIEHLSPLVTEERLQKFNDVLPYRTRHITVVLEDIFQSHNASAVLRSCDCFGIQEVHAIENRNEYELSREVTMGSDKWINLHKYNSTENNTADCISKLKKQGYTIVATTPHSNDCNLEEFPIHDKIALMFGTELNGLTDQALSRADKYLKIPMYGFTESFNISVSAALCLHDLTHRLRNSEIPWQLSKREKDEILFTWLKRSIKNSDTIIDKYLNEIK